MTIVVLESCPQGLRGDMTKWLLEINTGVYVGNISARVRDQLWERICANIRHGKATMVWRSHSEQGLSFKVHNTTWLPVDLDGITLMMRPLPGSVTTSASEPLRDGFSKAAKARMMRRAGRRHQASDQTGETASASVIVGYVVIDVETTGLNCASDSILEIAALKVSDGTPTEEFSSLVRFDGRIPDEAAKITGISAEMIASDGREIEDVMRDLIAFVGDERVVCHNARFDIGFLQAAAKKCGMSILRGNKCEDTLVMARRGLRGITSFKLADIAKHLSLDTTGAHRALKDCYLTHWIYEKLRSERS